jgi:peptidoglycan/xylan/chitin deacetylase (PgdA/CDA1 family)
MRAILTYHSIDDSGSPISVSPATFERHVAWLAGGAVAVEPLQTLASDPRPTTDGRHRVALTFDDAFSNFATTAWPRLRTAGLPVTVFVVSGHVGGTNLWGNRPAADIPVLPLASWDALAACVADGAEVGAHSRSHPHLSRVAAAALDEEIAGCGRDVAARLGRTPRAFAYPYGDYSEAIVARVATTYAVACTTEYRLVEGHDSVHCLPRLDMFYFQAPHALDDWGSPPFLRRIAARHGLRRLRRTWTALVGRQ